MHATYVERASQYQTLYSLSPVTQLMHFVYSMQFKDKNQTILLSPYVSGPKAIETAIKGELDVHMLRHTLNLALKSLSNSTSTTSLVYLLCSPCGHSWTEMGLLPVR